MRQVAPRRAKFAGAATIEPPAAITARSPSARTCSSASRSSRWKCSSPCNAKIFAERHPGELLDALVELDEGGLEEERELSADARLARAAQADQRDALAAAGADLEVAQIAQRKPERRRKVGELEHGQVRAAGLGVGDVATAQVRAACELRDRHAGCLARAAQAPSEVEQQASSGRVRLILALRGGEAAGGGSAGLGSLRGLVSVQQRIYLSGLGRAVGLDTGRSAFGRPMREAPAAASPS